MLLLATSLTSDPRRIIHPKAPPQTRNASICRISSPEREKPRFPLRRSATYSSPFEARQRARIQVPKAFAVFFYQGFLLAPGLILLLDDPRIVCYHFHDWQCDLRRLNRVIMHTRARPPQHIVGIGPMIIVWRATPIAEMVPSSANNSRKGFHKRFARCDCSYCSFR